jgi:sec-independent protein translocase protein TatB
MLDFGWQEFMVIAIATVLILGPKELPRVFRTLTGFMRKARSLAGEFHSAMDEMAKEADLADIKKEINKVKNGESDWIKDIDPTGDVGNSVKDIRDEMDKTRRSVNQAGSALTTKPASTGGGPIPGSAGGTISAPASAKAETAAPARAEASESPPKAKTKKASPRKAASKAAAAKKTATKKASARKAAAKSGAAKA